jgi:hypothetical protein
MKHFRNIALEGEADGDLEAMKPALSLDDVRITISLYISRMMI